ncbi:MAG: DUF4396 domain-containing protein [Streptosporangiaceae bacterium]
MVLDAATNPDLAESESERLRERLARAGLLAPGGSPRTRHGGPCIADVSYTTGAAETGSLGGGIPLRGMWFPTAMDGDLAGTHTTATYRHASHGQERSRLWRAAVMATLHCLTGCAIGEVLGMAVATALGWGNGASIGLAIVLAFFFGYLLTMRSIMASGVSLRRAVRLALASDTISIGTMEIIDNLIMLVVPGAMLAGLADGLFWGSLAISLAIAFLVTIPVNGFLIGRGLGHAVAHAHH